MNMKLESQLTVRIAQSADAANLVNFNSWLADETEGKPLDRDTLSKGIHAILEDPSRGFYLVAEMGGEVVGCLMITKEWSDWRNGDFWWIQSVYVRQNFRRLGVFRALYGEARKRAGESDKVCGLRLYVERDNQNAQSTYLNLGFEETEYKMFEQEF